ncbi:MEMO1 family [Infundibulicybe gibba]|nr:MEMO1 family [Infundibulicybe gibba]
MSQNINIRTASHAGSWYSSNTRKLDTELSGYLEAVTPAGEAYPIKGCKAIIAPHAGYSYSGPAAAWAYKSIDTTGIKRVFILGPSHHFYLNSCALSACKEYDTPLGRLPLDLETVAELKATGAFETLSLSQDEDEHSLEMHLPYVRKIFQGMDIAIVPVMVGAISTASEIAFGTLLAPYLAREDTLCVVSSDFCHWGTRFQYTYYYPGPDAGGVHLSASAGPAPTYAIHESITRLDKEAIDVLTVPPGGAAEAHTQFAGYLKRTKNTICGRHPIGVLFGALGALEAEAEDKIRVEWVRYEQSSQCVRLEDSSVSYASAWVLF